MEDRELTLKEIWALVWKRKKLIIRNTLIVSFVVAGISLLFSNWYKSTAIIILPSSQPIQLGNMGMIGEFGISNFLGTADDHNKILSILKSNSILEAVARKYNFVDKYGVDNMEEAIKALRENLDVNLEEEMQISVSFWDTDQEMVAEINNYIIYCLDSLNLALNTTKGRNNRVFIESRIEDVLDSLKSLEIEITRFMENEGLMSIPDQVRVGVESAAQVKLKIMEKEIELAVARNTFDENNTIIKQLRSELSSLRNKYQEFFKESTSEKLIPNFHRVPKLAVRYARLERQIEYYVKLVEFLGPQYENSRIEEMKNIPTIQVLDSATRPEKKDKPKRSRWVLAAFGLTALLSSYYVYFKDRSVHLR
jgi:uncharacterized protein involved in exopolysaccharide biosynthesis